MDPTTGQLQCRAGDEVMSVDDHKLGKIVDADPHFLTVEHGLLSKSRYFVPTSAVNACSDGKVYLNVSKDQATHAGWDTPPSMPTGAENAPLSH
ncbi:MAG: hypothetical protein QOF01_2732 [Thermomicrobiales bacterium]|jgi:hypothetical protein|nr:hypothetical protein [Thermomicrobiales bacterium]MEA2526253.1 hypothetical protein [Thermomicrobiales bacterium]MEA2596263.1 hypothetical protein [Thermomicrobiales bacterium]